MGALKILLVDDNPADRILTSRILSREFPGTTITSIFDVSALRAAIDAGDFDLVVTDYQLRWGSGLEVLGEVKARSPNCPVIMFASAGTQEIAVTSMMDRGLDDYVVKSTSHFVRLPVAIRSALERSRSRLRAERAERRVSHLLEHFGVGVFRMTPKGHLLEANRALFTLLGLRAEDAGATETVRTRLGPWPPFPLDDKQAVNGNHGRDVTFQGAGGQQVWLTVSERVDWTSGEPVIEGLVKDVSETQAARQQAEAANRAKDDFLAALSHELRTPLNAMVGWLRLLRAGLLDGRKVRRALDTIERNTYTLARLIDELLDVSRIVTGKVKLELRAVDLGGIVRAMMDAMGPPAQDKGLRLRAEVDPSTGPILGDPVRLQQVLGNLLSNAIKFTPTGGSVTVQLSHVASHAELAVSDTGKGIPSRLLPYIFDRFRQGEMATTRTQGGLGLGLAIARHLVELHGGTIRAESAGEGRGTTMTIQLPIPAALSARVSVDAARWRSEPPQLEPNALRGVRVLVVDDDRDACELLTVTLERWGATVSVATSAREAFAACTMIRPDVLVSDISMPGEDGYSLIRRLRAVDSDVRHVPAIALSALVSEEHRAQALAAGFDLHLPKPMHIPDLIRDVAQLAGRRVAA
jgi:signal transduction histidine kinase